MRLIHGFGEKGFNMNKELPANNSSNSNLELSYRDPRADFYTEPSLLFKPINKKTIKKTIHVPKNIEKILKSYTN